MGWGIAGEYIRALGRQRWANHEANRYYAALPGPLPRRERGLFVRGWKVTTSRHGGWCRWRVVHRQCVIHRLRQEVVPRDARGEPAGIGGVADQQHGAVAR